MKRLVTLLVLLAYTPVWAAQKHTMTYEAAAKYATEIFWIEGGHRAKVPYGILGVRVSGKAEARRVCIRTVRNTHARWVAAGKPGHFNDFLADRYCPPGDDPVGNANWKSHIHRKMKKHL